MRPRSVPAGNAAPIVCAIANLSKLFAAHPLTRDAPVGAWARFGSWQIRSLLRDEVIVSWIGGQKLAVRRGMSGATGNIYVGLHEFADMMLALHFLREADHFLDIGANVGSYTVLAAGIAKATVWAFEPDPHAAQTLRRNIELNGARDRVVVYELALGDCDSEVAFTRGLGAVNRVAAADETDVQTVPLRRLDTLVDTRQRPAMIKMDIEGYEEAAVRGAEVLLSRDSLKVIELETVTPEIEATFVRQGFERAYYDPFRRALTRSANDIAAANAVYVRDWEFVRSRLVAAPVVEVLGKSI